MDTNSTRAQLPVLFEGENYSIRVVHVDGEPWWIAADVCAALEVKNPRSALAALDDDEKGVVSTDTLGGVQQMTCVNEPGLYSLIGRSRKPSARKFQRWVTHEVLPSIRKTGAYVAPTAEPAPLDRTTDLYERMLAMQAEVVAAERRAALAERRRADTLQAMLPQPRRRPRREQSDGQMSLLAVGDEDTLTVDQISTMVGQRVDVIAATLLRNGLVDEKGRPTRAGQPHARLLHGNEVGWQKEFVCSLFSWACER